VEHLVDPRDWHTWNIGDAVETELGETEYSVFFLVAFWLLVFLDVPLHYCMCLPLLTVGSTLGKLVARQFGIAGWCKWWLAYYSLWSFW